MVYFYLFTNYLKLQCEVTGDSLVSAEVRRMGMETAPMIALSVTAMILFVVCSSFRLVKIFPGFLVKFSFVAKCSWQFLTARQKLQSVVLLDILSLFFFCHATLFPYLMLGQLAVFWTFFQDLFSSHEENCHDEAL